ncbi:MAG: alpha-galactosidase [Herbinix sp.]|jgi:hypothetical protein|nr:alpha-galactosidase [Herbinix sp.]
MENEEVFCKNNIRVVQKENQILCTNGKARLIYNLVEGTVDICNEEGVMKLTGVSADMKLADGATVTSKISGGKRSFTVVKQIDGFGEGIRLTVQTDLEDGLALFQNFYVYEVWDYILLDAVITAQGTVKTNYIAPLSVDKLTFAEDGDLRFLFVPFDNDDFIRYNAMPISEVTESYEVTSIFNNDTRHGVILGSVTHDTWKTGIKAEQGGNKELTGLTVFGGITSKQTRDTLPHGYVTGTTVSSPKIFVGFYEDYRCGMEAYGAANGIITPPLPWDKGIPMGWNSWSAVAKDINYDIYVNSSDFVKEQLQHNSFSANGVVFINFDAGWNKLTEEQLIAAANHVKKNGQKPGIYTTPFTFWGGKNTSGIVDGTEDKYIWEELLLKDEQGNTLPPLDSGYSIDPTHPGNTMRLKKQFDKFREWGYQYVKMDFMTHGAVEGVHFNKEITTGIGAYNYGMQQIIDMMKEEIDHQEFFISLSIAPLFPSQYAHSRRISCDIFGTINFAEYMLNSLTYGWWMNETVYRFNDPDHIVVYNSYNHLDPILYNEGLTRYISSAIAGTMMIDSDDFRIEEARKRTREVLTNEEINRIAKAGVSFRPVEGNTGDRACDCFLRYDEIKNITYLAVFNYSSEEKKVMVLDAVRIGLDPEEEYLMYDLCSMQTEQIQSKIRISLMEAEPKLFKIYQADESFPK